MKAARNALIVALQLVLLSYTHKGMAQELTMSFDETVQKIDSLCQAYYIDYKLNTDYVRQHPIAPSAWEKVARKIVGASPACNKATVNNDMGSFSPKQHVSESDQAHISEMRDSLSINHKWQQSGISGTLDLDSSHQISYHIVYGGLDEQGGMKVLVCNVEVTTNNTRDTVAVTPKNHRFCLLSNPPLTYAMVFDVEFEGHTYVVQELYDIRTLHNQHTQASQYTRACYRVK